MGKHGDRRRALPLTAVAVILIAAMLSAALAYGAWTDTLVVGGEVQMGTLDAIWTYGTCNQISPVIPGVSAPATMKIDTTDRGLMHFELGNGYPGYETECLLRYRNAGTIPWTVDSYTVTAGAGLTGCVPVHGGQSETINCDQLTVRWGDGIGTTIAPDDEPTSSSLNVRVRDGAGMGQTYGFTVHVNVRQ